MLAFAMESGDLILDRIPLAEVTTIEEMIDKNEDLNEGTQNISLEDFEKEQKFACAFQIHTIKHGFNSGRTYCLKTGSDDETQSIVAELKKVAAAAREKAEAKSRFTRSQDRVRSVCVLPLQHVESI
jgi:hypothetical protein